MLKESLLKVSWNTLWNMDKYDMFNHLRISTKPIKICSIESGFSLTTSKWFEAFFFQFPIKYFRESVDCILKSPRHLISGSGRSVRVLLSKPAGERPTPKIIPEAEIESTVGKIPYEDVSDHILWALFMFQYSQRFGRAFHFCVMFSQ